MIEASGTIRTIHTCMKTIPVLLVALSLAGCATGRDPQATGGPDSRAQVAPTRPAQLADATARELSHLARFEPETLETVYPELRALAAALVGAGMDQQGEAPDLAQEPGLAAPSPWQMPADMTVAGPPRPDMSGAVSLLHAVHLASYRREDMAIRGWAELQAAYPVLAGMDARLELAHIPEQGDFLRLKAGPFDNAGAARAFCAQFEAAGQYCMPVRFSGHALPQPD